MKGVRAKKQLGQHFLKDDSIALRITEALTHHNGYRDVIEIGPGTGALTKHLITRNDIDLWCIELDHEAAAHLPTILPKLGNRLIIGDFLHLDLNACFPNKFAIIGNFPYNISTEIIFKALEHRDRCMEVVGMFQKEVADRVRAEPGSKIYGITSVLAQAFYDIDEIMTVGPEQFIPPPKVQSAVIRMQRNTVDQLPCDEKLFTRVVKTAFNQRRKTLSNALKPIPELKDSIPEKFQMLRAERLSVDD
ncbi:MAG TPA: 16S rRNA (adenine(1518)-N(6)/adenine(1519)-N(6))-dimethyltransferase RsmA, partial [Flavobacteriales bacterium]|nr:16S rRNA (adenine(1518)-N(6)/adenine(1519)-N(6))-dimethyltransferase RsmA [Flavobacteriales bacterium]